MKNIEIAKNLLCDDTTCVIASDEIIYRSKKRGIAPVLEHIIQQNDISGFVIADRIVGKAAAMLFIKAGISEVYGEVMSVKGIELLQKYHIPCTYQKKVETIINRQGTDICPMEKTVQNIDDIDEAIIALHKKVRELTQQ